MIQPKRKEIGLFAIASLLLLCNFAVAQATRPSSRPTSRPWRLAADHADGIYRTGETTVFLIHWTRDHRAPTATYQLLEGQLTPAGNQQVVWQADVADVDAKLDHPGTLLLKVKANGVNDSGVAGAVFDPEKITPSAPKPADFDSFWDDKFKQLAAVPPNPQLTPKEAGKADVDYWQVTMDNIRGTHIRGQIARPHAGEKFPALLIVQWAGVYGLDKSWVTSHAAEGWLCLNINAHDLPIDNDAQFYKDQFAGPLKDYWAIGNDDRDTSYFLRMYLSCYRAAEYLSNRPDWNGKTLVVMGGSQGGQQSLLTASIFPKITAALADVPAGCDMLGPDIGRRGGWPQWYDQTQGKDAAKVHEASRYYDIVNFTPRITCPILVGTGLIDETCPAAGVLAAVNEVTAPKEIHLFPIGPHNLEQQTHTLYNDAARKRWLPALVKDQPAPVQQGID